MTTDTTQGDTSATVAEVKEKGSELASSAGEQISTKVHEFGEDAVFQVREQIEQRSTQTGEQVQAIGNALRSSVDQLRSDDMGVPAKLVSQAARGADELGGYLQSANADKILGDLERFARRRPWLTAGVGMFAGLVASRFVKASADRRYERRGDLSVGPTQSPRSLPAGGA